MKRDTWVDAVKIFACILVVLGHFYQSMNASGILLESHLFLWFNRTIYYFHVPLFFICSGYLYQKYSKVYCFKSWGINLLKKAISLGVPYFVFSFATWLLKVVFSGAVNQKAGDLFSSLFLSPISPYWYLYALFFLFLITPNFSKKKWALVGLISSLFMKLISFFVMDTGIYALNTILQNEIWFVLGMLISFISISKTVNLNKYLFLGMSSGSIFLVGSVLVYYYNIRYEQINFLMGALGCLSSILMIKGISHFSFIEKFINTFAKYTLPIFLMHTIFAAALRTVLFRLGIQYSVAHIVFGIVISFIGPIIATEIIKRIKFLDFILYPNNYLKISNKNKGDIK